MKRRGFLGFLGGAAVVGPGMAKDVALEMATGKAGMLASIPDQFLPGGSAPGTTADPVSAAMRATGMLTKLASLTKADLSRKKRNIAVYALDADIASYRSISVQAKIDWQRDRELAKIIENRKHQWGSMILGFDPYNDDPLA